MAGTNSPADSTPLPPLFSDRAYWGLNVAQFFGAFNDNLFKQLILLRCVEQKQDQQGTATALFVVPFLLLSGLAGICSDRWPKRRLIIGCKVAEIVIAALGGLAFWLNSLPALLFVLFLMGLHSAVFGPPKYGILPEMLRPADLPRANGLMLMLTFVAIIFGVASAGAVREWGKSDLYGSLVCFTAALCGTAGSLFLRAVPAAVPDQRFHWDDLVIARETRQWLWSHGALLRALAASSAFWLVAGMTYPMIINRFGKEQLAVDNFWTSLLSASVGVGIAVGCVLTGFLSRNRVRGELVRLGAVGMAVCLIILAIPGAGLGRTLVGYSGSLVCLVGLGVFAGMFSVPVQVFLQSQAPESQRGRMIAAMNFANFSGMAIAAAVYQLLARSLIDQWGWPPAGLFAIGGLLLLILAVVYRPPSQSLEPVPE